MTKNADFKALVRARMAETGQTYTAARADLLARPPQSRAGTDPEREQRRIVDRWFVAGRLTAIPAKRRTRAAVLLELVTRFEPGRSYPEKEVNALLRAIHEDFAYLRRELVNYGYLHRSDGIYRLADAPPPRLPIQAQEIPEWEALWLGSYLAGGAAPIPDPDLPG